MKVSEVFYSIQGEGINAGKPAVFLRLANCNLKCTWCDTKYSWDWSLYDRKKEITEIPVGELYTKLAEYDCNHLVITGGEPLLQQSKLNDLLHLWDGYVEIETNGTIIPEFNVKGIMYNVSPKLSNSKNNPKLMENPKAYRYFNWIDDSVFKFVISDEEDLGEVRELIEKYELRTEKILLMPEARTPKELKQRSDWIIDICKDNGFRFSPRLQVQVYGTKRGV